jgi:hypothetical protein
MKEYLIVIGITWLSKTLIDLGIKYSKTTKNTIDDVIFDNLKGLLNSITNIKKKKK